MLEEVEPLPWWRRVVNLLRRWFRTQKALLRREELLEKRLEVLSEADLPSGTFKEKLKELLVEVRRI